MNFILICIYLYSQLLSSIIMLRLFKINERSDRLPMFFFFYLDKIQKDITTNDLSRI